MTNPTPPARLDGPVPVGAWRVPAGRGPVETLEPGALPPVDEQLRSPGAAAGDVTWVRLGDVRAVLDAADSLAPAGPRRRTGERHRAAGGPGGGDRPFAHVRRIAGSWLVLVTPTAWVTTDDSQVHTGRFACLLGPGVVISAEEGDAEVHARMQDKLGEPGPAGHGPVRRVVAAAVLGVVGTASDVELELADAVAQTERLVFDDTWQDPVRRIYELKREITEARRALTPVTAELPALLDPDMPDHLVVDKRMVDRLTAIVDRLDRHLDAHDDLLSDMLQVHLSQVSVRQNEDMRKISAWAAILVYPTIVAGVYGMNFRHLPELGWPLGYPFALALMAVGCVVLYRVFRRAGWL